MPLLAAFSAFLMLLTIATLAADRQAHPAPPSARLQQPQKSKPVQQQLNPNNRGTKQAPLVIKTIPPERSQDEIQRENEKAELDRKTVQLTGDLVSYTWLLFIATSALALATGGLAAVAFFQMRDARRAIEAAEDSARAALRHVAVAEETAERQLRAYVFVGQAEVLEPDGPNPRLDIRLVNSGQTPAYDVVVPATVGAFNPSDPKNFPPPIIDARFSRSILGKEAQASKVFPLGEILGDNGIVLLRARTEHILYAWGEIHYRDIFKKPRCTKFRLSIGGPLGWPETNLMIVAAEGNEAE